MNNADVMDRLAGLDHYERWGVAQDAYEDGDEDATTLDSCDSCAVELDELDREARHGRG